MDAQRVYSDPRVAALATAAQTGDRITIAELVRDGVDVNARGDKGINLLQWALLHASADGLDALLQAGANASAVDEQGTTVTHFAAQADDPEYLGVLLAYGVDVDVPSPATGQTPLIAAMLAGRDAQVAGLLAVGADPSRADALGDTPLHIAGKLSRPDYALQLLAANADPQACNAQGRTFWPYMTLMDDNLRTAERRAQMLELRAQLREVFPAP